MLEKYKNDFFRDLTSFGGTYFFIFAIILFLLLNEIRIFKILLIGLFLTYIISFVIRIFYFKNRPNKEKYTNFIMKIDASSFPSVHSMRAIFMAIIISKFFANPIMIIFLLLWALIVSYSRVYIKKHYWIDIIVGLIIGILLAFLLLRFI
ncbi:phosphatase PAP2 family protein [Candidatus Woesearchaeota archaeon]|nr:phosphatase PAP2 family protein [Candidatus Woesearchaeota archaeon]